MISLKIADFPQQLLILDYRDLLVHSLAVEVLPQNSIVIIMISNLWKNESKFLNPNSIIYHCRSYSYLFKQGLILFDNF